VGRRRTHPLPLVSIGDTFPNRSDDVPTLLLCLPKGMLIEPSLVEAELADPNWKVDKVEFHPPVDFATWEWSNRVSLPPSDGVSTVRSLRMKPGEAAPVRRGRISGRHAPTIPKDDSTIGQYTKGVIKSAGTAVSFRRLEAIRLGTYRLCLRSMCLRLYSRLSARV